MSNTQAAIRAAALTSAELTTETELLAGRRAIDAYRRELRKAIERSTLEQVGKLVTALEGVADGLVGIADVVYDLDGSTKEILAAANTFATATWNVRRELDVRIAARERANAS